LELFLLSWLCLPARENAAEIVQEIPLPAGCLNELPLNVVGSAHSEGDGIPCLSMQYHAEVFSSAMSLRYANRKERDAYRATYSR
jgi:hypothetical protein